MNFLIDVNANGSLAGWLIELWHDVVQVGSKNPRMTDDEILSWATRGRRIIVTTDKDFEDLIWRQGRSHCGVLRLENMPRSERKALLFYMMCWIVIARIWNLERL